jgi:hypothetical protein
MAFAWIEALRWYEKAEALRSPSNDGRSCAGALRAHAATRFNLREREEEAYVPDLE